MNRTAVIASVVGALAVTFAAGFYTGRVTETRPVIRMQTRVVANGEMLFEGIDLTPAQRDSVAAILDRYRPRTDALLRAALPELRTTLDTLRIELLSVLTPAQRAARAAEGSPE